MTDFSEIKIKYSLLGKDGLSQVVLGQANTLRVKLTNQTGQPLPLTAGLFAVHLSLANLVPDAAAQAQLAVSAPDWTARFVADDDYPAWVLSPTTGQVWAAQQTLTLTVADLLPTVKAGTYYVDVELYNLDGLPPQVHRLTLGVVNPPSTQRLLSEGIGSRILSDSTLYSTKRHAPPVRNELRLVLYNQSKRPLVPDSQPWGPDEPRFILSLVSAPAAPGYYALTTPDALSKIVVSVEGTNWKVEPLPGPQMQWLLRPLCQEVLGTDENSLVEIVFRNVVTSFRPGPTLLYVQGLDVPGYTDGFLTELLEKKYQLMQIKYFRTINSDPEHPDQATLQWKVDHATDVLLSGVGPVAHEGSLQVRAGLFTRSYELTAFDTTLGCMEEQHVRLPDSLPPVPVGTIVAWSGPNGIPPGWLVCDGTHGTPDLRDCFVLGAGDGSFPHPHDYMRTPMHSHAAMLPPASVQVRSAGEHTHLAPANWYMRRFQEGSYNSIYSRGTPTTPLQSAGEHTHTAEVHDKQTASLSMVPVPRPAWYALLYLQYQGLPG